jgi:hypothetical protein
MNCARDSDHLPRALLSFSAESWTMFLEIVRVLDGRQDIEEILAAGDGL